MTTMASQITSLTIVYSTVYSVEDQRKHQSSASLAFVWGVHRGPVNSPHKWPVTRKMFPFDDVIMVSSNLDRITTPFVMFNCCVQCLVILNRDLPYNAYNKCLVARQCGQHMGFSWLQNLPLNFAFLVDIFCAMWCYVKLCYILLLDNLILDVE